MDEEANKRVRRASINDLDGNEVVLQRHGTVMGSIFNLCNCMLGVGVLALPAAFARVGVVLGAVLLVACAVLVLAVYHLVNLSLNLCPTATTYSGLLADSLGPKWAKAYDVWVAVTVFGTTVAWNVVIAGTLTQLLVRFNAKHDEVILTV